MLVLKVEDVCNILVNQNTHVLLFGGKPFKEERFIYWNFVSSSKEKLHKAKADWRNKKFPKVPGDST
jgi:redox-sensitive bicupin YhaK (pirin superfamily)